jgi:toxin FitB
MSDGMIAAIAMRHNATLATGNAKDFAFLGLEVVNPWD